VRFDAAVPHIALQGRDVIEHARVEAAHVVIGLHVAFVHAQRAVRTHEFFALRVIHQGREAEEVGGQQFEDRLATCNGADAGLKVGTERLIIHENIEAVNQRLRYFSSDCRDVSALSRSSLRADLMIVAFSRGSWASDSAQPT
jgi:hypothetical protein